MSVPSCGWINVLAFDLSLHQPVIGSNGPAGQLDHAVGGTVEYEEGDGVERDDGHHPEHLLVEAAPVPAYHEYGQRGDWSYIPGGVVSGTALIRPDFPELLEFPFLWQQTEYVLGGGSSHYMFLVLAANGFQ